MAKTPNAYDRWREQAPLYRDAHTGLPMAIHPFVIRPDLQSGEWTLSADEGTDARLPAVTTFSGIFPAFRAMLDALEMWLPAQPKPQVYFIGPDLRIGSLIKIGHSRSPEKRLKQIQTGSGQSLRILVTTPGDRYLEQKYHRRWSSRRQMGEWFVLGQCIIDEIERLKSSRRSLDGQSA